VESVLRDAKETAAVEHYWHAAGRPKSSLRRARMLPFFPSCLLAWSAWRACGTSDHWAPRQMQVVFEEDWRVVGCCHLSGLWCSDGAAGPYGSSRTGTKS